MDSFDYIKYLKEGRIHEDGSKLITEAEEVSEKKYKQGYDDREDESLGARRGAEKGKKQSFKDRRDDSYGKFGKRDAEAKGKAKGPGKNKVNKEGVDLNLENDLNENLNPAEQQKVMSALSNYVERFKPNFGKVEEIADMLSELTGISSNKIQSYLMQLTGGDDEMIFEMEDEGTAVSYSDTMEEKKDHDGDGDIDSDDYLAARDKAIKKAMGKKPKKESIDTKLAEIGKAGEITKMEAQLEFLNNYIQEKSDRINSINEDDNLAELVDKKKMKDMMKEIKLLEKRKGKMEKMYEKMSGKKYQQTEVVDEAEEIEEMDAVSWNEKNNPTRSKAVGERDPKKVGQSTSAYAVNQP